MKANAQTILIGGALALAAYIVFRPSQTGAQKTLATLKAAMVPAAANVNASAAPATPSLTATDFTRTISSYDGWTYYTDGTAIAPNGDYYQGGALIWSNPK